LWPMLKYSNNLILYMYILYKSHNKYSFIWTISNSIDHRDNIINYVRSPIYLLAWYYRPDHLERRWYQNQQQRQTGGGGRLIRGLGGAKHLSDVYDDDDLLRLQQQDDATVAALFLDDVGLGGGYSNRNSVSVYYITIYYIILLCRSATTSRSLSIQYRGLAMVVMWQYCFWLQGRY